MGSQSFDAPVPDHVFFLGGSLLLRVKRRISTKEEEDPALQISAEGCVVA